MTFQLSVLLVVVVFVGELDFFNILSPLLVDYFPVPEREGTGWFDTHRTLLLDFTCPELLRNFLGV